MNTGTNKQRVYCDDSEGNKITDPRELVFVNELLNLFPELSGRYTKPEIAVKCRQVGWAGLRRWKTDPPQQCHKCGTHLGDTNRSYLDPRMCQMCEEQVFPAEPCAVCQTPLSMVEDIDEQGYSLCDDTGEQQPICSACHAVLSTYGACKRSHNRKGEQPVTTAVDQLFSMKGICIMTGAGKTPTVALCSKLFPGLAVQDEDAGSCITHIPTGYLLAGPFGDQAAAVNLAVHIGQLVDWAAFSDVDTVWRQVPEDLRQLVRDYKRMYQAFPKNKEPIDACL